MPSAGGEQARGWPPASEVRSASVRLRMMCDGPFVANMPRDLSVQDDPCSSDLLILAWWM